MPKCEIKKVTASQDDVFVAGLTKNLRLALMRLYAIYYLPLDDEIIIVRVLHGSRDIASIADEGGFAK